MKLSIIIPVYRVEATLNRCVESVLNQNLDNFEVILVDDGSPDNCPQMCDDWAGKNANIRVIHKSNGGLSDARNAGVEKAQGDYITFVDSDDYLAAGTYQPLLETLARKTDLDIIEFPVYEHFGSKKQHLLDFPAEKEYTDMDDYWYRAKAYKHTYACNKIYRRELFDDVRFPTGIAFEDANTLPLLLKKATKVMTANTGLYYYCYNPSGITSTADGEALSKLLQAHLEVLSNSTRRDADSEQYFMHVLNIQMDVFEFTGKPIQLENRKVNIGVLQGRQKLKGFALNLLGLKNLCTTNKIFHKIWRNH